MPQQQATRPQEAGALSGNQGVEMSYHRRHMMQGLDVATWALLHSSFEPAQGTRIAQAAPHVQPPESANAAGVAVNEATETAEVIVPSSDAYVAPAAEPSKDGNVATEAAEVAVPSSDADVLPVAEPSKDGNVA